MTNPATATVQHPADPMISVIGLYKSFGDKNVLNGIDIEVARGESLMLVGGSGAGATTTSCLQPTKPDQPGPPHRVVHTKERSHVASNRARLRTRFRQRHRRDE